MRKRHPAAAPGGEVEQGTTHLRPLAPGGNPWGLIVATALGGLSALPLAGAGWLVMGGTSGYGIGGTAPLTSLATLLWVGSATALVVPPAVASRRLWPLRSRLAAATVVGGAWFLIGRYAISGA